jgi:hypothetical protein
MLSHPPGARRIHRRSRLALETLEARVVLSQVGLVDDRSASDALLQHTVNGPCNCCLCTGTGVCELAAVDEGTVADAGTDAVAGAETADTSADLSAASVFALHSRPGASKRIFLDFDGHVTTGTTWNSQYRGGASIVTPAYDTDGKPASFSSSELAAIRAIWERVVEDYSPFDVDVTTEDPGVDALRKSSAIDAQYGVRVVIGGSSSDWYGASAGGVAYTGSFTAATDTPAFVFPAQLARGNEKYVGEAISHEVGHTLGLSHDGRTTNSEAYYAGHGSGETSWAPIMGSAYTRNVTQWSKGEYAAANNTQDDLSIITTRNGFSYRPDDAGDTVATAASAVMSLDARTLSAAGVIERTTDVDVYSFTTEAGAISLTASPAARGPNLDILLEVLDASSQVIAWSNPTSLLGASLSNLMLGAGVYYARISGVGVGSPTGTGYSDYASLGQYTLSGTVAAAASDSLSLSAANPVQAEGGEGAVAVYTFTVDRSGPVDRTTTATYAVVPISATAADFGGQVPSGQVTFEVGQRTATFTVSVVGNRVVDSDRDFDVRLVSASGETRLANPSVTARIVNDDVAAVLVSTAGLITSEARGSTARFSVSLSAPPTATVTIPLRSNDTTEGRLGLKSLTFTPSNWNVPQTVVVTGVDDLLRDGDVSYRIELSGVKSSDPSYNGLSAPGVGVVNRDNERPAPAITAAARRAALLRARALAARGATGDGDSLATSLLPTPWASAVARRQALRAAILASRNA